MTFLSSKVPNDAKKNARNQYLATTIANVVSFNYGMGLGWASPNVPILLSSDSPLDTGPVSLYESSWISSLFCIGGIFGAVLYSFIVDVVGRKWSLTLIGIPQVVSWFLIAFVMNIESLLIARFLIGFSAGGMLVVIPVFVTEISNDKIRGTLGNFMGMNICMGTLFAFILSHFYGYTIMPIIALGLAAIFIIVIQWFPDTPRSLLMRNQAAAAEYSRNFYNRFDASVPTMQLTLDEKKGIQLIEDSDKITLADLMVPTTRKGILLGLGTITMTQFCGSFAIINYTATIFKDAGSTLHPNVCAMVIALIQVLAVIALVALVDRIGRKILLLISAALTAAFHIILGFYFFYQSNGYDVSSWAWLPLVCLSGMMFFVIGISTSPIVVAVEVLPPKLRSSVPSAYMLVLWMMAFLFVRYFNTMVDVLQMHGSLWFFAGCCILEFILVAIFLPETKGKPYEEIRKALS